MEGMEEAMAWGAAFIAVFLFNVMFVAWRRVWRANRIFHGRIYGLAIEEMRFHRAGVVRGAFLQSRRGKSWSVRRKAFIKRWLLMFPGEIARIAFSSRIWVWCAPQFVLLGVALLVSRS